MKAKGKRKRAKGKRSALFRFSYKAAQLSASYFCLLLFAFCLLLSSASAQERINLNTASAAELMRLPYVGQTVARRIVDYRRKHGAFKRPQDIIIIKGLSAKRYREIAHLIRI